MSDAFAYRIYAAQRDLIERCGTVERVAEKCGFSKSEVGRWRGGANPEFMPLGAIAVLERDCGAALVTAVLAEANGRRLSDPEVEQQAEISVMTSHAELMRLAAELATSMAHAIADSQVTPSEAQILDRKAAEQERALSDLRASLAVVKARGGVKAELRIAEDAQ